MNVLFITSDQQRGDCYGFEGRKVKTPHLDAHGARRHALLGVHHAEPGVPALARLDPDRACCRARTASPTTASTSTRRSARRASPARSRKAGYRTGYIGKAHFATSHTFKPTGTPECRNSDQDPDWTGPYMGFEHVELMVEGHNHWPPMKPPRGQHYERWFHQDGRGEELQRLYETQLEPRSSAMQTFHSALPVAFHNSTWIGDRTIEFLKNNTEKNFCVWASFPDPAPPVRRARAVEPAAPSGRSRPAARAHARPRAPAVVAPAEPRGQAADRRAPAQDPRAVLAHPGAHRPAAARADRQLLRHDLADRPQRRTNPS